MSLVVFSIIWYSFIVLFIFCSVTYRVGIKEAEVNFLDPKDTVCFFSALLCLSIFWPLPVIAGLLHRLQERLGNK
jgi:hypothetical protein